jgi:heme/copper-type cytochrome/quinol oxidase subunit 1
MKFQLPPSFRNSRTVRFHSFAFAALAVAGLAMTAFFRIQPIDLFYYDTYFVVAMGHIVFAAATLFGVFAVAWTLFEAFTRRRLHETLGQIHFWMTLAGILLLLATLLPLSFSLAHAPGSAQGIGMTLLGTTVFTLVAQLVFPLALIASWSRPKAAGSG